MNDELAEAAARYALILSVDANNADALLRLALIRFRQGQPEEAEPLLRKLLLIDPALPEAHNSLGAVLRALRRHGEAVASFQQALTLRPGYAEVHNNLGNVYFEMSRYDEAVAEYDRALAARPAYADALANRATALKTLGRLNAAASGFAAAIALAPTAARLYLELSDCKRFSRDDAHLASMQALIRDPALSDEDRMHLHFALAKALTDLGEHEAAFAEMSAANDLKRRHVVYDEAAVLGEMTRIAEVFTPALLRTHQDVGNPSPVPVFIVGMPRSGSTLVEQILASHPAVVGAGEINDFPALAAGIGSGGLHFPEAVPAMTSAQLHGLGSDYLAHLLPVAPAASRITDKLLANFRHVGLIHLALPKARVVHTRRDPVDTCLSCYSKLFTDDLPFAYDLGELGRYYRAYDTLMAHWRSLLPPDVLLEVQYEAVVADIEREARRIVAHLGLPWDDRCLAFYRTERPVRTASANQVRQPIYRTSVERSRAYAALLQPLRDALGHPLA